MFSYESHVGRLVEIRFGATLSLEDVRSVQEAATANLARRLGSVVSCVDMRYLNILRPDVADALVLMLKRSNPRVERTACLLPSASATLALQIERMHRDAGGSGRQTFRQAVDIVAWLGEVLDGRERDRLRMFLKLSGAL